MFSLTTRRSLYVALITALIFLPMISRMAVTGYDYLVHIPIAEEMLSTGRIRTPHFLLQAFAILLSAITGGISNATVVTLLVSVAFTAALTYRCLRSSLDSEPLSLYFTAALLFASPVAALFPLDRHLYLGYIGVNVLHNPTMILLKPFALLLFTYSARSLESDSPPSHSLLALCAIVTVAAAMAKPSFTIVLLPAISLMMLILWLKGEPFDRKMSLLAIMVPSLVILLIQYRMTYSTAQIDGVYNGSSSIIFSPLLVMNTYSTHLLTKFLLSVLFPLTVTALYYRETLRDRALQLAWLTFGAGALYTYLLAESGPRMNQGNFTWSAQIALFILFVASTKFLVKKISSSEGINGWRVCLCTLLLTIHFAFGIIFHMAEFVETQLYW